MLRKWKTFGSWQDSKKSKNDWGILSEDASTQIPAPRFQPRIQAPGPGILKVWEKKSAARGL